MDNRFLYRKKPVVIEAFQYTATAHTDETGWPQWLLDARDQRVFQATVDEPPEALYAGIIETLEGNHRVSWGDWIIRGVQNELYPCKPDIFEQTYEKA